MSGLPPGFVGRNIVSIDIADLTRRVREIETRQRILAAHLARLLASMESHNAALASLEKVVSTIMRAMKSVERHQVDA